MEDDIKLEDIKLENIVDIITTDNYCNDIDNMEGSGNVYS